MPTTSWNKLVTLLIVVLILIVYPLIDLSLLTDNDLVISVPVISNNNNSIVDDENITFISNHSLDIFSTNFPPFLISFPASGNTFTRLLIEYVTLKWSGSIYRSPLFKSGFKGELDINNKVIVIKLHPLGFHKYVKNIINMQFENTKIAYKSSWISVKRMLNKYNEEISAIFILRDLFKTCWSFFQFQFAKDYDTEIANKYSLGVIRKHLSSFILTQNQFNSQILPKWINFSIKCAQNWLQTFEWIDIFKQNNKKILLIQFKKLIDPQFRRIEMNKILNFIFNKKRYLNKNENRERMLKRVDKFYLNSDKIYRNKLMHRDKNRLNRIHFEYAYSILSDQHICKMINIARNQTIFDKFELNISSC